MRGPCPETGSRRRHRSRRSVSAASWEIPSFRSRYSRASLGFVRPSRQSLPFHFSQASPPANPCPARGLYHRPGIAGRFQAISGDLPDCLNHERFSETSLRGCLMASKSGAGMMRIPSKWILAAGTMAVMLAGVSSSYAQQTIRVGWTIPAEESKYWMMRRPTEFPDLGKTYNIEWTQFQGTAPMTQALAAGALDCATQAPLSLANGVVGGNLKAYIVAQHVFEKPGGFSVYWAVMDDSPIKTIAHLKTKTIGISVIGGGPYGPFAVLLKQNGADPGKNIKLVATGFSGSDGAPRPG